MNGRERNLGIDALRVLCMLAVVVYHLLGHGWIMSLISEDSWKYELLSALQPACLFGITCFALISGYVGVQVRYKYSSLILQWMKVWFYSVLLTGLVGVFVPESVAQADWNRALYPVLSGQYWYFSAYVGCFMFAPVIRLAVRKMSFRQAGVCTALIIMVFSALNTFKGGDPFFVNAGKGTLWLVVLYEVGAYFGWFKPHEKVSMTWLCCFAALAMLLLAGLKPVAARLGWTALCRTPRNDYPETLMAAIAMLLLFSRIRITHGKRFVSLLGAASFGVYLIHDHPFVRRYTISVYAYHLAGLGTLTIVPGVLLASMGVYLVCAFADTARQKLFDLLRIKQGLDALERRLIGNLWED